MCQMQYTVHAQYASVVLQRFVPLLTLHGLTRILNIQRESVGCICIVHRSSWPKLHSIPINYHLYQTNDRHGAPSI